MSQYEPESPQPYPKNHLAEAILVTLCCCLPFGIVAIAYAAQVNGKYMAGDVYGAQVASANAKKWCWVGFGFGIIGTIIYAILQLALMQQQGGFR